jgi:hypothetical protein
VETVHDIIETNLDIAPVLSHICDKDENGITTMIFQFSAAVSPQELGSMVENLEKHFGYRSPQNMLNARKGRVLALQTQRPSGGQPH